MGVLLGGSLGNFGGRGEDVCKGGRGVQGGGGGGGCV